MTAASTVIMTLGGVSLGPIFPLYAQNFQNIRQNEQGPAFRKVMIGLSGFVIGDNSNAIRLAYKAITDILTSDRVAFVYTDTQGDVVTTIQNRTVYVDGFTEPSDWKQFDGQYEISLYYFTKITQSMDISAAYDGYSFTRLPSWAREFEAHRESIRDTTDNGTTATITLEGFLSADSSTELATLVAALDAKFVPALSSNDFGVLSYGDFSHSVKVTKYNCASVVEITQAYFSIEFQYDIGDIVEMRCKRSVSRLHFNPVVKDQPTCGTRIVKLGNLSGQDIDYNISVTCADLDTALTHLATEAAARIIPGGIEWPGGTTETDENTGTAILSCKKFYNIPVLSNLDGTDD